MIGPAMLLMALFVLSFAFGAKKARPALPKPHDHLSDQEWRGKRHAELSWMRRFGAP